MAWTCTLDCPKCGETYWHDELIDCPNCGTPMLLRPTGVHGKDYPELEAKEEEYQNAK